MTNPNARADFGGDEKDLLEVVDQLGIDLGKARSEIERLSHAVKCGWCGKTITWMDAMLGPIRMKAHSDECAQNPVTELRDENERLRKAGDMVCRFALTGIDPDGLGDAIDQWQALSAKDRKKGIL